jgi:hypothetical protein
MTNFSMSKGARGPFAGTHILWLVVVFAIEAAVFYWAMVNQYAPYFPRSFDQTSYYLDTYELIDRVQATGWQAFLEELLQTRHATGLVFTVYGALLGVIIGPWRTAIISLNLVHFLALQLVLFAVVRDRTRNVDLAWIAIALLLLCGAVFMGAVMGAGGIYDYRIDFAAFCLYGIWVCLIVWSRTFRDTERALIVGVVGIFLVLLRFFTVVYVAAILGTLLISFIVAIKQPLGRRLAIQRARNVLLSGLLTASFVCPVLFLARDAIYSYYVVGHFLGEEKYIRAQEAQLFTALDHLLFYPKFLFVHQIGNLTARLLAVLAIGVVVCAFVVERASSRDLVKRLRYYRFEFIALGVAVIAPLAILTIDISKSPVVGAIVVVPVILTVVLFCAAIWPRKLLQIGLVDMLPFTGLSPAGTMPVVMRRGVNTGLRKAVTIRIGSLLSISALIFAIYVFVSRGRINPWWPMSRADLVEISRLNTKTAHYVLENGIAKPIASFDRVVDYFNRGTLQLFGFEEFHRFTPFEARFGHGIFATERDIALELIEQSDIVLLTDPLRGREAPYPMNTKIREYWDELSTWTAENRLLLAAGNIMGIPHRVFVKPPVKIQEVSKEGTVSTGISMEVDASNLRRWPFIVLEGEEQNIFGELAPRTVVLNPRGDSGPELPAKLNRFGGRFEIVVDAQAIASETSKPIKIKLTFGSDRTLSHAGIVITSINHELRASGE